MDREINAPGHGKNVFDGLNATNKNCLKGKMEPIGKLARNDTSKIEILPRASKYVSIKSIDQYIHIINNKDRLNGLKGCTKMQKREYLFKYQSHLYNIQSNYNFERISITMGWNNNLFPSLNDIIGK